MKIEGGFSLENKIENERRKTSYFSRFALKHFNDMKILGKGGILGKGAEKWRNISEHCLVEAVGADILTEYLGVDRDKRDKVVKTALWHDWYKRREIEAMQKFGGGEGYQKTADEDERLLRESGIPEDMIKLAHSNIPENSDLNNLKNRSIEEKIIHFVDLITIGSEFVNFAERLQISEQKRQNIEFSESFRKKYNGKSLYEVQREAGKMEQAEFEKLLGLEPETLINFISAKLEERIKFQP